MIVAYLRVSTGHQVLENQKNEIERFAEEKGITIDRWVTEVVSGKKKGKDRRLGRLIRTMKPGDQIIVTEVSRLSRTLLDIMTIMGDLLKRGISLYSVKDGLDLDDSINTKVLIFAFGLVAEIERNLISMRTREALQLRKQLGIKLGRPYGASPKTAILEERQSEIAKMMKQGVSKAAICRKYDISYSTLKRFFERNNALDGTTLK